jgi:phosphatase and actin regulator 4
LVQKNILRGISVFILEDEASGTSSAIIQQKKDLEEEKKKDQLSRKLSLRPTPNDLKAKNILKGQGDPLEEDCEEEPTIEERASQLKSILKKRPKEKDLLDYNILKGSHNSVTKGANGASANIISAQESLKRSILEDTLESKIAVRPTAEELEDKKILLFAETVEVLPTFRKSEYNRKPDATATFKNLTQQMKVEIREELNTYKKEEMPIHPESNLKLISGEPNTCFH